MVVGFLTGQKLQQHQLIGSVFALVKDELKSNSLRIYKSIQLLNMLKFINIFLLLDAINISLKPFPRAECVDIKCIVAIFIR